MSPKSVQRFWDNDMHKNKDVKRVTPFSATRFSDGLPGARKTFRLLAKATSRIRGPRHCQQNAIR
ncbi:MAG: hypothetical protein EOQ40_05505 [Mesorhizobium sp.]|nr:MAG: hypothetical protein EOQ40_05505 [Mesorhizobium sp.]